MTNFEKFKDELKELVDKKANIAIDKETGVPCLCNDTCCGACALYDFHRSCRNTIIDWLLSEYEEVDWGKVPIDTPVLVRKSKVDTWRRRYFAGIREGMVTTYPAGRTSWSDGSSECDDTLISWPIAKLYKEEES